MIEPMTTIFTALIAGAAAAATQVAGQTVNDAYAGLKQLVIHKLGGSADIEHGIQQVEGEPESKGRQLVLQEELGKAAAAEPAAAYNQELLAKAQELLKLLEAQDAPTAAAVRITQAGSGGLAYGAGAKAAGERGVAADTIHGSISTGDNASQRRTETYTERQINTGGGAAVEGDVNTGGGDFVGRDKKGA